MADFPLLCFTWVYYLKTISQLPGTPTAGGVLLMVEEIRREKPPFGMVLKPIVNHGTNYRSLNWDKLAGFRMNHQQYVKIPACFPLTISPPGRYFGLAMSRHGVRHPSPTALAYQGAVLARPASWSNVPTFRSRRWCQSNQQKYNSIDIGYWFHPIYVVTIMEEGEICVDWTRG